MRKSAPFSLPENLNKLRRIHVSSKKCKENRKSDWTILLFLLRYLVLQDSNFAMLRQRQVSLYFLL